MSASDRRIIYYNYDLMGDEFICRKAFFRISLYIDAYYYMPLFIYVNDDIKIICLN